MFEAGGVTARLRCSSRLMIGCSLTSRVVGYRLCKPWLIQIAMGGQKPSPHPGLMERRPAAYTPMGITAEIVASRFGVSRADQDAFAYGSHQKAVTIVGNRMLQAGEKLGPFGAGADKTHVATQDVP